MIWLENFFLDWFYVILPIHTLVCFLLFQVIKICKKHSEKWWYVGLVMLFFAVLPMIILARSKNNETK